MAKGKLKRVVRDARIIILLVSIAIAFVAISPNPWESGIFIKSVERGGVAEAAGVRAGDSIVAVNGDPVSGVAEFSGLAGSLKPNESVLLETGRAFYKLSPSNGSGLGLRVAEKPKTNIKTGLDLRGGTRLLLQPKETVSPEDLEFTISTLNERLNVFGLADVSVRDASDFTGTQYIMVEMAGVNEDELREIVLSQGKFEARISNESVFGGSDIIYVCRSSGCSGIDFNRGGCQRQGEWVCPFFFSITISQEAAERQADATRGLGVVDGYLTEKIFLYLDGVQVDEPLNIGEGLKGRPSTAIQISGSGSGASENLARDEALAEMKKLQTILITGSLPVELGVARSDSVSPALGEQFVRNALLTGLVAMAAVMTVLFIVYRKLKVAIPIMFVSISEIFLLLGVASLISWNIDLAGVAGIIAAVGTGVNDQIIIADEALRGQSSRLRSWKEKLKSAFSVIFGAYFTLLFAMIPLFVIGAGLLRGFAVTTIIGMTVGVLVTRPAFARIVEILTEE